MPIERAKLPSLADLQKVITLPGGGKPGSAQRARLRDVGAAIVKAICAAVNPDGELVEQLIVEALTPLDPLDERQRRAADATVVKNIVASYMDAKRRGLSKQEQRQRLSALAHDDRLTDRPWLRSVGVRLQLLSRGSLWLIGAEGDATAHEEVDGVLGSAAQERRS